MLHRESIRRTIDEAPCDHCRHVLRVGDDVMHDLHTGALYCCQTCAHRDTLAREQARFDKPAALRQ